MSEQTDRLLLKEQDELNIYARHNFQLLVAWFSVFSTTNLIAIGWFLSLDLEKKLKTMAPVPVVVGFYIVQNLLGIMVCRELVSFYRGTEQRLGTLIERLAPGTSGTEDGAHVPLSLSTYCRTVGVIQSSLISFIVFWSLLLAAVVFDRYF